MLRRLITRIGLAAAIILPAAGAGVTSPNQLRILLPLYAYPEWWDAPAYIWDDVAAQGSNAPIVAIINPTRTGFPQTPTTCTAWPTCVPGACR